MAQTRSRQVIKQWRVDNVDADACGQQFLAHGYLCPTTEELKLAEAETARLLHGGQVQVVIPMHEQEPVVANLLEVLVQQIPLSCITVIDDGSSEMATAAARSYGVEVQNKDEILSVLHRDGLLEVLQLNKMPTGKGMTVLAGYLFNYLKWRQNERRITWLLQHDADVVEYRESRGVDYLAYGIAHATKGAGHIKLAQPGRGNEWCMSTRNSLPMLSLLSETCPARETAMIAERAGNLQRRLAKYKWMLSGQFALSWGLARQRPFATGYLEETLICAFVEDYGVAHGSEITAQVEDPVRLADGLNDYCKEAIILQQVSNFLVTLALIGQPVCDWTLDDVRSINARFMKIEPLVALIPPTTGPVEVIRSPSERIVPSLTMIEKAGLIRF